MILNQYNLSFTKIGEQEYQVQSDTDYTLASFLTAFEEDDILEELLDAVNLAINNNFNQIEQNYWGMSYFGSLYSGSIEDSNMTFVLRFEAKPVIIYPLNDIKEILESLIEFIQSSN